MNLFALAARCAQVTPNKLHVVLPLLITAMLYWLSSLPGTPLPDDPALYALFYWVSPSVQNAMHVPAYAALAWAWRWGGLVCAHRVRGRPARARSRRSTATSAAAVAGRDPAGASAD